MNRIKHLFLFLFLLIIAYFLLKNWLFERFVARQNRQILSEIEQINAGNAAKFAAFIKAVETETEWKVMLTSGYRTAEEQRDLQQSDRRNAKAGRSKHNFGRAIDLNLYQNKGLWFAQIRKSSSKNRWEKTQIVALAKKHGLIWGGNFSTYYDPVHFEL